MFSTTSLLIKNEICLSVRLCVSQAEIIVIRDIFLGSIGVKITKKSLLFTRKRYKTALYQGICRQVAMHGIACVSRVWCAYVTMAFCVGAIYLTQKLCVQTAGVAKMLNLNDRPIFRNG